MHIARTWLRAGLLIAAVGMPPALAGGCVGPARGGVVLLVRTPPPPPPPRRRASVREQRPGYAWVSGHWERRGAQWVWKDGYWVRQRPNYVYVPGRWVRRGDTYHWVEPYWKRLDEGQVRRRELRRDRERGERRRAVPYRDHRRRD